MPKAAENFGFAFEVSLLPTLSQVGQYPYLLQNIVISGTDTKTGQKLEKNLRDIDSELTLDKKGIKRDGPVMR